MSVDHPGTPFFYPSMFPVQRALMEIRPSSRSSLFQAWRPSEKNRRAARIGNGTRMARAMLKRLDVQENTKSKKRF
jgi:hypothetical protein